MGKAKVTGSQESQGNLWKKQYLIWPWENEWRQDKGFSRRGEGVSRGMNLRTWSLWSGKGKDPGSWSPGHEQGLGDQHATLGQRSQWRPDVPVTSCRSLTHLEPHCTHLYNEDGEICLPQLSEGIDGVEHRRCQVLRLASI